MQEWFDAYGESHRNPINKLVHWICVPAIFLSLIGLLSQLPFPSLVLGGQTAGDPYQHWGSAVILIGLIFYFRTSAGMALGMLVVSAIVLFIVSRINLYEQAAWIYLTVFVLAWIGQFIGHKVEGKKPSFLQDLKFLLIGPAWLLGFIYRKLGIPY